MKAVRVQKTVMARELPEAWRKDKFLELALAGRADFLLCQPATRLS